MPQPRPPIFSMVAWAYWDLVHVLRNAWRPALIATVIVAFGIVAAVAAPRLLTYDPIGQMSVRQIVLIGLCFLLTPYLVTIHRGLLLGEWTTRYRLLQPSARFQLYFGWFAMSVVMLSIPSFLEELAAPRGPVYYGANDPYTPYRSPIVFAARAAAWFFLQYFLVLFPAVAVDARGATWQNAIRDARQHFWFVLAVAIVSFIPVVVLSVVVLSLVRIGHGSVPGVIAGLLVLGVICVVLLTLAAAIGSRLYQVVGDRLNAPVR